MLKRHSLRDYCLSSWPLSVYKRLHFLPETPVHTHDSYEIMVVIRGEGTCMVGESEYVIRPGTLFLCKPEDLHAYVISADHLLYNVMFADIVLSDNGRAVMEKLSRGAYQLANGPEELELLERICSTMESELINRHIGYECLTGSLMDQMVVSCLRRSNELPGFAALHHDKEMERLLTYIQEHYREKIMLPMLAKFISRSPSHCGRLFLRNSGVTFTKYLLGYRINRAEELLKNSELSLTEIAFQTGFCDSAHFSKSFYRVRKMTPTEFRMKFQTVGKRKSVLGCH